MMEWISVTDRLPIDYKKCKGHESAEVIIVSDGVVEFCEFSCGPWPEPWFKFEDFHLSYVTDWMNKPEPPNPT